METRSVLLGLITRKSPELVNIRVGLRL